MKEFSKYFIIILLSVTIILDVLRIIKLFFNPGFLNHKAFDFPEGKFIRFLYYLCAIMVALLVILLELKIIE
jgi:hypothetical protein